MKSMARLTGLLVIACSPCIAETETQVTRADADDHFYAEELFRRNGMELDRSDINRVVRGGGEAMVWVNSRFSGLPVFYHDRGYNFENGNVVKRARSDEIFVLGELLPPSSSFPIDHRPDIDPDDAAQTWLDRIRLVPQLRSYTPAGEPDVTLGFHNLHLSSDREPEYRLAWRVRPRLGKYPEAMISAKKGDILFFDSGIRSGGVVPNPGPRPPAGEAENLEETILGSWKSTKCFDRTIQRRLTFKADKTFAALDYVSPCPPGQTCADANLDIVERIGEWNVRTNGLYVDLANVRPRDDRYDDETRADFVPSSLIYDVRERVLTNPRTGGPLEKCEYRRIGESPGRAESICSAAVQGKIAWDYEDNKNWNPKNVSRLCAGAEDSEEPARCFDAAMHAGIDNRKWNWDQALNLCAGTTDAESVLACYEDEIQSGKERRLAITHCSE